MSSEHATSIRTALRTALTSAIKQRERAAVSAYRSALAAIENAEAVPVDEHQGAGTIEHAATGVGTTDVARRTLGDQQIASIVRGEIDERRAAADSLETTHPQRARVLRDEARVLDTLLG